MMTVTVVKKYYVDHMNQRLLETTSFQELLDWIEHNNKHGRGEDYTFTTSDFEGRCSDVDCNCRVNYGFNEVEQDKLVDYGVDTY